MTQEGAVVQIDQGKLEGIVKQFNEAANQTSLAVAGMLDGLDILFAEAQGKIAAQAAALNVVDQATMDDAVDFRKRTASLSKNIEAMRKACVEPFNADVGKINALFKPFTTACAGSISVSDKKVMTFEDAIREAARIEEAKLAERAEKKQERELDKADKLEEDGKAHQADAARTRAAATVAPKVEAPKATGVHRRKTWQVRIEDPKAFIKAAYEQSQRELYPGEVSLFKYLLFNDTALKKLATSSGGEVQIPGIKFWQEEKMVGR